jgi:hypothetical protein
MRKLVWPLLSRLAVLSLLPACAGEEAVPPATDAGSVVCELNWDVKNVAPCVVDPDLTKPPLIYSSHLGESGAPECEASIGFPQPTPADPWSDQTLIAETTGSARLCIAMKQGSADAPTDGDCVLFEHCFDASYEVAGELKVLPALPAWAATDEACSRSYYSEGGYVELRASSDALGCSGEGEQVRRLQMCPLDCQPDDARSKCARCATKTSVTGAF